MKSKKLLVSIFIFISIFSLLILPAISSAQGLKNINSNLDTTSQGAGVKSDVSFGQYAALLIKGLLALLGLIFLILIIYSGVQWMTAMGVEDKITKSKKIIVSSVIGLIIIILAYAIASFIIDALANATR